MTTATQQTAAAASELNEKHFEMLRLAKLRGLTARRIGEGVYCVPSYTRQSDGIEWVVTLPTPTSPVQAVTCSCRAGRLPYCTHRATVVDRYFTNEVSPTEYGQYIGEGAADRARFLSRIQRGALNRNDKTYLRYCVRFAERQMRERDEAKASGIRTVETTRHGRTVRREYVGAIQI